jgi:hypothetical protein
MTTQNNKNNEVMWLKKKTPSVFGFVKSSSPTVHGGASERKQTKAYASLGVKENRKKEYKIIENPCSLILKCLTLKS